MHALQLAADHLVAEIAAALRQGVPPRVFAQHQPGRRGAHHLRLHDLVGRAALEHARLVDPGFVRERVAADDGLVGLRMNPGDAGEQLARPVDLGRIHGGLILQAVPAHFKRHHDLLQRRVARPFTDAVDGALHLPGARFDGSERVRHGEPEVVVAMDADHHVLQIGDGAPEMRDEAVVLRGIGVAHRIGNVDGGGTRADRGVEHLGEELVVGPGGVFRTELDVIHEGPGPRHGGHGLLQALLPGDAQLVLEVEIGRRDEDMDARPGRALQRPTRRVDVSGRASREGGDDRALESPGNPLHRRQLIRRADGKARLDNVHAELVQLAGHLELLRRRHGGARRLLAIPQRGVENENPIHGLPPVQRPKTNAGPLSGRARVEIAWYFGCLQLALRHVDSPVWPQKEARQSQAAKCEERVPCHLEADARGENRSCQ